MSDDHPKMDLDDLDDRLKKARMSGKSAKSAAANTGSDEATGFSMAMRVGTEMVASLIVGVGIGLLLDNWLDTGPWFLVVFFFLGSAAGFLNVYRLARGFGAAPGYLPGTGEASSEDESKRKKDKL